MGFRINTNIAALNAQRHLTNISGKLDKSLERLASGLRINKAADDASGMATSVYLRGQIRGLYQATRNANDAISMTQTAEGALDVTTNILLRLRELAVQAATDTTNRTLLISESTQLIAELTRVATDTEFVGNTLLNGSFQSGKIQIGANQGQTISFSIGDVRAAALGALATTTVDLESDTTLGTISEGGFTDSEFTINGTGIQNTQSADDQVSVLDLVGTTAVRNFAVASFVAGSAATADALINIAANDIVITNGVDEGSLGALLSDASIGSIIVAISTLGLAGITVGSHGTGNLHIDVTSGYDFGVKAMSAGAFTAFNTMTKISAVVGTSGTYRVKMNDGGTAKISGLVINGETIATVNLAQGASIVGVGSVGSLADVSNTDANFIQAMITAIDAVAGDTNVTARVGSATTMLKTMVLTATKGENVVTNLASLAGGIDDTADLVNATGLSSNYFTDLGDQITTTFNGETSAIAKVAAIDSIKSNTKVDAVAGAATVTAASDVGVGALAIGDLYINGIDIGAVTLQAKDANYALTAAINAKSSVTGVVASHTSDGSLVLTAADGRNISVVAAAGASEIDLASGIYRGSVTLNSSANFSLAGATDDLGGVTGITGTYTTSLDDPVSGLDLSTQTGADSALAILDSAINQVNTIRSGLGAIQARITLTIINLTTTAENLSASDSRIKDVDFASETSIFTKNSILTQAATAILAQANQLPQLALQLLG